MTDKERTLAERMRGRAAADATNAHAKALESTTAAYAADDSMDNWMKRFLGAARARRYWRELTDESLV